MGTQLRTNSLTQSLTHSPTHPPTHPLAHSLIHSHTHPLTRSLTHSLTHSLARSLARSLRPTLPGCGLNSPFSALCEQHGRVTSSMLTCQVHRAVTELDITKRVSVTTLFVVLSPAVFPRGVHLGAECLQLNIGLSWGRSLSFLASSPFAIYTTPGI